jgi:hypothetical protein
LPVSLLGSGILMIAVGTAAFAQGTGYTCIYNCGPACGSLSCYPDSMKCGNTQGHWITNDPTLYGACAAGSGSCTTTDSSGNPLKQTCMGVIWTGTSCGVQGCEWDYYVYGYCKC